MSEFVPSYNLFSSPDLVGNVCLTHVASFDNVVSLTRGINNGAHLKCYDDGMRPSVPKCQPGNNCPNVGDPLAADLGFKVDYSNVVVVSVTDRNNQDPNGMLAAEFVETSVLQHDSGSLGRLIADMPHVCFVFVNMAYTMYGEQKIALLLPHGFYEFGVDTHTGCFGCLLKYMREVVASRSGDVVIRFGLGQITVPWFPIECISTDHDLGTGCPVEVLSDFHSIEEE